ncbi:MAG: hypothetical protein KC996_02840 [Phycisphaerales bacterium]|nr:hypothetical protein [Phycisphaerales bacterium]
MDGPSVSSVKWKMPRRHFQSCVLPVVPAVFLPMIYAFVYVKLIDFGIITAKQIAGFSGSPVMYAAVLGGIVITLVWIAAYAVRSMRYIKRFRECGGKLCFVCDYDLSDGQRRCPECGALWEPEKLGKNWRKFLD